MKTLLLTVSSDIFHDVSSSDWPNREPCDAVDNEAAPCLIFPNVTRNFMYFCAQRAKAAAAASAGHVQEDTGIKRKQSRHEFHTNVTHDKWTSQEMKDLITQILITKDRCGSQRGEKKASKEATCVLMWNLWIDKAVKMLSLAAQLPLM